MTFRNDTFLLKCIVLMVLAIIVLSQVGCASMPCFTEASCRAYYDSLSAEELQALKDKAAADPRSLDEIIYDIGHSPFDNSRLVCIDGDCVVVDVY